MKMFDGNSEAWKQVEEYLEEREAKAAGK